MVVAGTGTEVGKTWVAVRLVGALLERGARVAARKPAQSFDPGTRPEVTDAGLLAVAAGVRADAVCPPHRWYERAMAPPMAAEALGRPNVTLDHLVRELGWPEWRGEERLVGLVETAGGLRSPQAHDGDGVDLAEALGPDLVVLVGDAGLGTINTVRLSVEALAARRLDGATVVVLNRFDPRCGLHVANRQWLAERYGLDVVVTPGDEGELADRVLSGDRPADRARRSAP